MDNHQRVFYGITFVDLDPLQQYMDREVSKFDKKGSARGIDRGDLVNIIIHSDEFKKFNFNGTEKLSDICKIFKKFKINKIGIFIKNYYIHAKIQEVKMKLNIRKIVQEEIRNVMTEGKDEVYKWVYDQLRNPNSTADWATVDDMEKAVKKKFGSGDEVKSSAWDAWGKHNKKNKSKY